MIVMAKAIRISKWNGSLLLTSGCCGSLGQGWWHSGYLCIVTASPFMSQRVLWDCQQQTSLGPLWKSQYNHRILIILVKKNRETFDIISLCRCTVTKHIFYVGYLNADNGSHTAKETSWQSQWTAQNFMQVSITSLTDTWPPKMPHWFSCLCCLSFPVSFMKYSVFLS